MSTTVSPESESEFETTVQPPFPWRIQFAGQGEWVSSADARWHELSEPTLIDGHLFHLTRSPVFTMQIELPMWPNHGQAPVVVLCPPPDTPVFYFKRMAASATGSPPRLLYAAYGYVTKEAAVQVRLSEVLRFQVVPLFLPRPLLSPF